YTSRRGKGWAIKKALQSCSKEYLLYIDSDLPASLKNIKRIIIKSVLANSDIVYGNRLLDKMLVGKERLIISKSYRYLVRFLFKTEIKDFQAGFKMLKVKTLRNLIDRIKDNKFFFDTE